MWCSSATHCNTLQHTATHCNTLQHTATHCNTLQHAATHCNTLQHESPSTCDVAETQAVPWIACRAPEKTQARKMKTEEKNKAEAAWLDKERSLREWWRGKRMWRLRRSRVKDCRQGGCQRRIRVLLMRLERLKSLGSPDFVCMCVITW